MNYKILSLDVWDTILRRKCDPDAIKVNTSKWVLNNLNRLIKEELRTVDLLTTLRIECEKKIGSEEKNNGNDDEYCISDVFTYFLNECLIFCEDISSIVEAMVRNEVEHEKKMTYLDPEIIKKINEVSYEEIIIISDFYMSGDDLLTLLRHNGFDLKIKKIYSSCDVKLNKRSGRLFDYVLNDLKIAEQSQIHIGDNHHSDVVIPNSKGIRSIHYNIDSEILKKSQASELFHSRKSLSMETALKYGLVSTDSQNLYDVGKGYSIVFFAFILNIIENAMQNGAEKVYYFTREGEFYKKIHDEIECHGIFGAQIPKAEILEVSRLATFGPSLREISLEELMRVWNLYSTQSMRALFKTINLDILEYTHYFELYQIDIEQKIQYPWLDDRIINLFGDQEFIKSVTDKLNFMKSKTLKYFNSKGVTQETKDVFVVDIGWRGTIQDNIAYLFNQTNFHGYYFGLFDFINNQPENVSKHSYLTKKEMSWVLRNVAPFEMMCNSNTGSVLRYVESDGNVVAQRLNESSEDTIHEKYIKNFQQGIIDQIKNLSSIIEINGITFNEIEIVSKQCLEKIMLYPPKQLAKAFFSLSHNEIFGIGDFVDKKKNFPTKIFLKALVSYSGKKEFKRFLEDTTWPQGFLTNHNMDFLVKIYNEFMKKSLGIETDSRT